MLSAATAGMGLCHVLQAPPRMLWSQQLWVDSTVHGGLYSLFGSVGAVLNVGAVVALGILAWKERRSPERARAWLAAAAFAGFAIPLLAWFAVVAPVNAELATWLTQPVPADWADYRWRWETAHTVNTMIQWLGFSALVGVALRPQLRTSPPST